MSIASRVQEFMGRIPEGITVEAACKTRTAEEIQQAVNCGIKILGHNYVQEAEKTVPFVKGEINWHLIGHLQSNKAEKAVQLFDVIETLDSIKLAGKLNKYAKKHDKKIACLIEINSGRESNKSGIYPEEAESFINELSEFINIKVLGLMTMGPFMGTPDEFRPYFSETKKVFESLKALKKENVKMEYLSMGMSASYKTAIEEGANIIRIGTSIFGDRNYK